VFRVKNRLKNKLLNQKKLKPDFSATIAVGIWTVSNDVLPDCFAAKKKGTGLNKRAKQDGLTCQAQQRLTSFFPINTFLIYFQIFNLFVFRLICHFFFKEPFLNNNYFFMHLIFKNIFLIHLYFFFFFIDELCFGEEKKNIYR